MCLLNRVLYNYYNMPTDLLFHEWLVGLSDGESSFIIRQDTNSGYCYLRYKLPQSAYNSTILKYIKRELGSDNIVINNDGPHDMVLIIADSNKLKSTIVPIFDKYPLHTFKYFRYQLFRQGFQYLPSDPRLLELKHQLNSGISESLVSPHSNIPSISWIVGFIEAEGSFYIATRKGAYKHVFSVSQKRDKHVLEQLRGVFGISANIHKGGKAWKLETDKISNIHTIIHFFDNRLVGVKHLEFNLWKDSFLHHRNDPAYLASVQSEIRLMRNKHKT